MINAIARFFRSVNANLIASDNRVTEKLYKISFGISVVVYRVMRRWQRTSRLVVVRNFDRDIRIKVDVSKAMGSAIFWTGYHEFREFLFLHRFLTADMVFADVGANQGEYTLFAAKRLSRGKVMAFEPLPSMQGLLRGNVALNGFSNVLFFDFGLSDRPGTMTIYEIEGDHEGLATAYPSDRQTKSSVAITLETLDAVFSASGLKRLDLIKMDIEGGELRALAGCNKIIETFRPVVLIEINRVTYKAAGYEAKDVHNFFTSRGYKSFELGKRGHLKLLENLPDFGNVVFMPR